MMDVVRMARLTINGGITAFVHDDTTQSRTGSVVKQIVPRPVGLFAYATRQIARRTGVKDGVRKDETRYRRRRRRRAPSSPPPPPTSAIDLRGSLTIHARGTLMRHFVSYDLAGAAGLSRLDERKKKMKRTNESRVALRLPREGQPACLSLLSPFLPPPPFFVYVFVEHTATRAIVRTRSRCVRLIELVRPEATFVLLLRRSTLLPNAREKVREDAP